MSIYDTIEVRCAMCSGRFKVTAARHRRLERRGQSPIYFCSIACNRRFVAHHGKAEQDRSMNNKVKQE